MFKDRRARGQVELLSLKLENAMRKLDDAVEKIDNLERAGRKLEKTIFLKNCKDLAPGGRCLIKSYYGASEYKILEVSPDEDFVKLLASDGKEYWIEAKGMGNVEFFPRKGAK